MIREIRVHVSPHGQLEMSIWDLHTKKRMTLLSRSAGELPVVLADIERELVEQLSQPIPRTAPELEGDEDGHEPAFPYLDVR